jgi:hypothetical protein
MNDELITGELIAAVKESVTGVHMTIPAEQITSRSRAIRARRRIPALAGAMAVIAAVAVAVTVLPGHRTNSAAPLSVRLLAGRAAAAALSRPSVRPGQWVYREIKYRTTGYPPTPGGNGTARTWMTAAGTPGRVKPSSFGFTYPGTIPYSELGSLPSDPAALEDYLGDHLLHSLMGEPGHAGAALQQIYGILWEYVPPPKLAAELFHALADVPGITVRPHVTDVAGRPGVAFVLPPAEISGKILAGRFRGARWTQKRRQELILNPSHYTLMAVGETVVLSVQKRPNGPVAITRNTTFQQAIVRQAFVSRPGVRS